MSQFLSSWLLDNSKIPKKNTIYNDSFLDYYYNNPNTNSITKTILESKIVIRNTDIGLHFILQVLLADLCYVYENIDSYIQQFLHTNDDKKKDEKKLKSLKQSRLLKISKKIKDTIKNTISRKKRLPTIKQIFVNKITNQIKKLLYQTILLIVKLLDIKGVQFDDFDNELNNLNMNVEDCVNIADLEKAFKILISKYILLNDSLNNNIDDLYQIIVYIVLSKYLLSCGIIVHQTQEEHIKNIVNHFDITKLTDKYILKFVLYIITLTKTTTKNDLIKIIVQIRKDINTHMGTEKTEYKSDKEDIITEVVNKNLSQYSIINQIKNCYLLNLIFTCNLYMKQNNLYDVNGNLWINKNAVIDKNSSNFVPQLTETNLNTTKSKTDNTIIKTILPTQFPIKSIEELETNYSWLSTIINFTAPYYLDHRGLSIINDKCEKNNNITSYLDTNKILTKNNSFIMNHKLLFNYKVFYMITNNNEPYEDNIKDKNVKRIRFIPDKRDTETSIGSMENEVGDYPVFTSTSLTKPKTKGKRNNHHKTGTKSISSRSKSK